MYILIWLVYTSLSASIRKGESGKTKQINFIKTNTTPVQRAGNDSIEILRIFRFNVSLVLEILNIQFCKCTMQLHLPIFQRYIFQRYIPFSSFSS